METVATRALAIYVPKLTSMLMLRKTGLSFLPSDVQALICSSLCGRQRTLAALAQTCKSLNGPALKELWRVIPCLEVIAYTLPPRLWTVRPGSRHVVRNLPVTSGVTLSLMPPLSAIRGGHYLL